MLLVIIFFTIYLNIGMIVFQKLHFKYYEGLHKNSKSDTWLNKAMCWIVWPAAVINFIVEKTQDEQSSS